MLYLEISKTVYLGVSEMKSQKKNRNNRRGVVVVTAMIFLVLLATLSIAAVTMTSSNARMAKNQSKGNRALSTGYSGIEVVRYLLHEMNVPETFSTGLQDELTAKGLTDITATFDGNTAVLAGATLNSTDSFNAEITDFTDYWQVDVEGVSADITRNIRIEFDIERQGSRVFDFGVATKGPLVMSGQTEITGFNLAVESDVFIDTSIADDSFQIGNKAMVEGDVHIVNSLATYDVGTNSSVGGETGAAALDHIFVGVEPVEFPTPMPEYFRQYAVGDVIDSNSTLSDYSVMNNVTIAANTNPTFASDVRINGVLFVEQPNKVKFSGKVDIYGVIVGNSEVGAVSTDSSFEFAGKATSHDATTLTGAEFEGIKDEAGTFLMAPGSYVDFAGQSNTINGAIACSGGRFTGQAGGTINGSIINYSSVPMEMQGQGSLSFNRSGYTDNPAGFMPTYRLVYNPTSYSEIIE